MKLYRWNTTDRSMTKYPPMRNINCLSTVSLSFEKTSSKSSPSKKCANYNSAFSTIKAHRTRQIAKISSILDLLSINNAAMSRTNAKLSCETFSKLRSLLVGTELVKKKDKEGLIKLERRIKVLTSRRRRVLPASKTLSAISQPSLAITQIGFRKAEKIAKRRRSNHSALPSIECKFQPIIEGSIIIKTKRRNN
eukprot:TRINITY_DN26744_c0_g1_i2.p1 TRINITY_DN26744_c0_g1~~TRINITY_DN26744_c0_g1_i2.p1  ORF type:complete len:227 (+),score=29.89 TRINITY_DN26744_c0_g1_i2:101-682(+)